MTVKVITVPRLRLPQLQTLAEDSLKITSGFTELADSTSKVKAAYDSFTEAMKKDKANSDKQALDRSRDTLNSGLFAGVRSDQNFPHDKPTEKILTKIVKVTEKYGLTINRLSYDEQTAATDNMVAELEKIDFGPLVHLSRWIPQIKAANESFKAGAGDYLTNKVETDDQAAATLLAPTLEEALEGLYTLTFAHAQVSQNEELIKAYKKLVALVDSYR